MDAKAIVTAVRESLEAIRDERFYDTERGFQGQLLVELAKRLPACPPDDRFVLEQEYQKTLARHGLTIRPDVIIHQPFDPERHASRRDGNLVVLALKLRAGPRRAADDMADLMAMLEVLRYPLGVFINIDSTESHSDLVPPEAGGRIVAIATRLEGGEVLLA